MALRERGEPETLDRLLPWCARRLPGRGARLARFPVALERLGLLRPPFPVVKIAGTNGKGSVGAMLSAALHRDRRRVGLFTSPHLERFTERIRVAERDVAATEMEASLRSLVPLLDDLERDGGLAMVPSFFEVLLMAALRIFTDRRVDVAILEAGVGGAHDAVSVLEGPLAAVTSVALDHAAVLGDTAAAVAGDKAGIASRGSRLVVGSSVAGEALAAVKAAAGRRGVTVIFADAGRLETRSMGLAGHRVGIPSIRGLGEFRLPLAGAHQVENLAVVAELVRELVALGIADEEACIGGVEATRWPGRLETVPGSPAWLIDAAHNLSGFEALATDLPALTGGGEVTVLYGASEGHAFADCLRLIPRLGRRVHLVEGFHRSVPVAELRPHVPAGAEVCGVHTSVPAARDALEAERGSGTRLVLATGSIYMIGRLREQLTSRVPTG
jgi:folylpolyglutamate synthase/dihydrofolate synthase